MSSLLRVCLLQVALCLLVFNASADRRILFDRNYDPDERASDHSGNNQGNHGNSLSLQYVGAAYALSPSAVFANPALMTSSHANIQGVFDSQNVGDSLVVNGYENFYSPHADGVWASVIVLNQTGTGLVELSRIPVKNRIGTTYATASRNPARPYVVVSNFTPKSLTAPLSLSSPSNFSISIYPLDWTTGIISQTPSLQINMKELDPFMYDYSAAYNGFAGMDASGRWIGATWLTFDMAIGGLAQKIALIEINPEGTTLTIRASISLPATPSVNYLYFTQRILLKETSSNKLAVVIAANSYSITGIIDPFGVTGSLLTYMFDLNTYSLVLTGNVPYNQYGQGFDLSPDNTRIVLSTVLVGGPEGLAARIPYPNNASAPFDNFRVYSFDALATSNAIALIKSFNTNTNGVNVRFNHDGSKLAMTSSPNLYAAILPDLTRIFAPSMLQVLKASGDQYETVVSGLPAIAPNLALGLTWSTDDKRITVSGMTNPTCADALLYTLNLASQK